MLLEDSLAFFSVHNCTLHTGLFARKIHSYSLQQPFSTLLYARMGNGIATNQLMKMIAGAINPGRPVANLYVRSAVTLVYVR